MVPRNDLTTSVRFYCVEINRMECEYIRRNYDTFTLIRIFFSFSIRKTGGFFQSYFCISLRTNSLKSLTLSR